MQSDRPPLLFLKAALFAVCILTAAMLGLPLIAQAVARKGFDVMLIHPSPHREMGVVLQREAFRNPHVLPMYGSSEMSFSDFPNRPDIAFAEAPSGFQVSPIGKGGSTSLIIAQKLAAVGPVMAGKKVVIMVSPSWFRRRGVIPEQYTGNFSELQASLVATSNSLSYDLRHRFALRMLAQRQTLEKRKALSKTLWRLREPEAKGELQKWVKSIGLRAHSVRLLVEDYALTFADWTDELLEASPTPTYLGDAKPGSLPCEKGESAVERIGVPAKPSFAKSWPQDDYFAALMANAAEWVDFEILLDTMKELKAKPLVIAMPMEGEEMERLGIGFEARKTLYYERMQGLCAARGAAFDWLPEQEHNPDFLYKHKSHLSNTGWASVNALLDRFYHDLPLRDEPAPVLVPKVIAAQPVSLPRPMIAPPVNDPLLGSKAGEERTFALPSGQKMIFCYCPAGDFTMGSPSTERGREEDEKPVPVHLSQGFWLAKTECSQAQWKALAPLLPTQFLGDELPVEQLADFQALDFLKLLGPALKLPPGWLVALPTEAQWEWACRAGTSTAFAFGTKLGTQHANFATVLGDDSEEEEPSRKSCAVGAYKPNAWGLHDMHGNVFEYCADWYAPVLAGGTDPQGPPSGQMRVIRGGCWSNLTPRCRSAFRSFCLPNNACRGVGLRPALGYVGSANR